MFKLKLVNYHNIHGGKNPWYNRFICFVAPVIVYTPVSVYVDTIQLLTNEALDMMWYRPDNTNIDRGEAEVNIGILWSISHHIQCLISQ